MNFNNSLILDACCLINFCASGRLERIIKETSFNHIVSKTVHKLEMLDMESLDNLNPLGKSYQDLINNGLIQINDFKTESEIERFYFYARIIQGDGEAASLTIAESNNLLLATDDKKAISMANKYAPIVKIRTTPEIIKSWADVNNIDNAELKDTLLKITKHGHYKPSNNNPLKEWWENIIK